MTNVDVQITPPPVPALNESPNQPWRRLPLRHKFELAIPCSFVALLGLWIGYRSVPLAEWIVFIPLWNWVLSGPLTGMGWDSEVVAYCMFLFFNVVFFVFCTTVAASRDNSYSPIIRGLVLGFAASLLILMVDNAVDLHRALS